MCRKLANDADRIVLRLRPCSGQKRRQVAVAQEGPRSCPCEAAVRLSDPDGTRCSEVSSLVHGVALRCNRVEGPGVDRAREVKALIVDLCGGCRGRIDGITEAKAIPRLKVEVVARSRRRILQGRGHKAQNRFLAIHTDDHAALARALG